MSDRLATSPQVNRRFGLALAAAGVVTVFVFVGADMLGSGSSATFGYLQIGGAVAGMLGLAAGLAIAFVIKAPVPGWMINVFVSAVALVVVVVLVEMGLRWLLPSPPRAELAARTSPDPVLGYRLTPGSRTVTEAPQAQVIVEINSQGLRDVEHTLTPDEGVFRIVVLGDSFMEGFYVELDDIFSRQLEALFHEAGYTQVEVINLGVGGYNTLQEYLIFEDAGLAYRPDLVLLSVFLVNDIADNAYQPSAPTNYFYDRPDLVPGSFDEWDVIAPDQAYNVRLHARAQQQAEAESASRDWQEWELYQLYQRALSRDDVGTAAQTGALTVKRADPHEWLATFLCDAPPTIDEGWLATERIVARLSRRAGESGAEFVVFSTPSLAETDEIYRNATLDTIDDPESFCFDPPAASERLDALVERQDIGFIDLLPGFRTFTAEQGRTLFYTIEDRHWAPNGHRLAAEIVYQALVSRGLVPPPD